MVGDAWWLYVCNCWSFCDIWKPLWWCQRASPKYELFPAIVTEILLPVFPSCIDIEISCESIHWHGIGIDAYRSSTSISCYTIRILKHVTMCPAPYISPPWDVKVVMWRLESLNTIKKSGTPPTTSSALSLSVKRFGRQKSMEDDGGMLFHQLRVPLPFCYH